VAEAAFAEASSGASLDNPVMTAVDQPLLESHRPSIQVFDHFLS
jgi:hypothetical protein